MSIYRKAHPKVTFEVLLRDRAEAEQALLDISADIALVFEPVRLLEFQHILTIRQPVHAIMAPDHPLAGQDVLRLRDIVQHPV
ncbi:MAG: LysR substrate-binding domain-containing protein, partial [Alphaproteobacteria bacterium]